MKTLEKMILCCIWICIAIVCVLIKDQADLKQKALLDSYKDIELSQIEEKKETVILSESEVMELVASNVPVMKEASLAFSENGEIQMNVIISEELINEAKTMFQHEAVSIFLPMLEGIEVVCKASISANQIGLTGCKAGFMNVPEELLELAESQVNQTWKELVENKGIEKAEVDDQGLHLSLDTE